MGSEMCIRDRYRATPPYSRGGYDLGYLLSDLMSRDSDGDGTPDNLDSDDDNDGIPDEDDEDDDGDGIPDTDEDPDMDGIPNSEDEDDDNDGVPDSEEEPGCEIYSDCDNDGVPDDMDGDDHTVDSDDDGIPDNLDSDDDNDGIPDEDDEDDDGDDIPDTDEDPDMDGIPNSEDEDDDNDGVPDSEEEPGCEIYRDCDGDNLADGEDPDDHNPDTDGDGIEDGDEEEGCVEDPDCDDDGIPDGSDPDFREVTGIAPEDRGYSERCGELCYKCFGIREAHCHAQMGICVCEEGDLWHYTSESCEETASFPEDRYIACCAAMFAISPEYPERFTGETQDPCAPPSAITSGIQIDYCRTISSETGFCCSYAFDEKPISLGCNFDQATGRDDDGDGGVDEDPIDGIDNDMDGKTDEDGGDIVLPEALPPSLNVKIDTLRYETQANVFYPGDTININVKIENNGNEAFVGEVEVYMDYMRECDCPPCPEGYICECQCSPESKSLTAVTLDYVLPGQSRDISVPSVDVREEDVNITLQPRVVIKPFNEEKSEINGPVIYIVEKDRIAVIDAYFTDEEGNKVVQVYPGERVKGSVVMDVRYTPVDISVYAVRDGNPVEESRRVYTIEENSEGLVIETGEIEVTGDDIDDILRIGVDLSLIHI